MAVYRGIYLPPLPAFALHPSSQLALLSSTKCDAVFDALFPAIMDLAVVEKLDIG